MALKDETGNWINRNGNPIPEKNVPKVLKKRDATVTRIIKKALNLEKQMMDYKEKIGAEVTKYLQFIEKSEGFKTGETKGNITLTDYSGLNQICIQINDSFEFDERLNMAKNLIDECMNEWSNGANENLKALITEAFNVDKKGRVNQYMIMRLKSIEINHLKWKQAISLINQSQNSTGSRKYIMLRTRDNKDAKWTQVNLNFSSM